MFAALLDMRAAVNASELLHLAGDGVLKPDTLWLICFVNSCSQGCDSLLQLIPCIFHPDLIPQNAPMVQDSVKSTFHHD